MKNEFKLNIDEFAEVVVMVVAIGGKPLNADLDIDNNSFQ